MTDAALARPSSRRRLLLAATACGVLALWPLLPVAQAGAASAGEWRVAWTTNDQRASVNGVACPSASECVVAGWSSQNENEFPTKALILRTTNSGRSWVPVAPPRGSIIPLSVTCVNVSDCLIAGDARARRGRVTTSRGLILASTDGGLSWQEASLPTSPYVSSVVNDIACPSASQCYALAAVSGYSDSMVYTSTDGGLAWSFQGQQEGVLRSLACITVEECAAVGVAPPPRANQISFAGTGAATADGWLTSRKASLPSNAWNLSGVACPSSTCYAVGTTHSPGQGAVVRSDDGGVAWAAMTIPAAAGEAFDAISCPTATECVFGGEGEAVIDHQRDKGWDGILTTTDAGASWSFEKVQHGGVYVGALACADAEACVAAASRGGKAEVLVRE